jgi:GTPase SAR1 family protein
MKLCLVREQFAEDGVRPFYDLRHQVLFKAMCEVADRTGALDTILLLDHLDSVRQLTEAGGLEYVASLPDHGLPSMLEFYLEGVWEKHLARQIVFNSMQVTEAVRDINGVNETLLGRLCTLHEEFIRKTQRGAITPAHLKPVNEFGEAVVQYFFTAQLEDMPGHEWPFPFCHKFRKREATLMFGDDGSGKSTFLSYLLLHLLQHPGEKAVMASFEVPPEQTLWTIATQLLGRKRYTSCEEHRVTIGKALAWLNARLLIYDFQGIANWREVRDTFRYAVDKEGVTLWSIDNAMRMGIADDDYAQQALAAATLHQFAEDTNTHGIIILHDNKGDGKGKAKIRGSKLWSANMNNVLRIARNEEKGIKLDRAEYNRLAALAQGNKDGVAEEEKEIERLKRDWDSEVFLLKQRYPGTKQNGSKRVWFDAGSFQFRHDFGAASVNWLERWRPKPKGNAERGVGNAEQAKEGV